VPNKHGFLVCFPATAVEQKQLHGISCSLDHGASFGESPKLFILLQTNQVSIHVAKKKTVTK
jgi:hypothetical protein